jgi:hypothetical protein
MIESEFTVDQMLKRVHPDDLQKSGSALPILYQKESFDIIFQELSS